MEKVKAREIFNKVKKFNELAKYLYQGDKVLTVRLEEEDGTTYEFNNYNDFSRFVRKAYIEDIAIELLNEEWQHDGEYFTISVGRLSWIYELYVHTKE